MTFRPPEDASAAPPYFHVGIWQTYRWYNRDRSRGHTKFNMTYEDVARQFVIPYQRRDSFLINGTTIDFTAVSQIVVSQSEDQAYQLRDRLMQQAIKDAEGTGKGPAEVKPWDVVRAATVVTDQILGGIAPSTHRQEEAPTGQPDPRRVFVVHGRDEANRNALFAFLRSIDLDPIEWSEARKATGRPMPYVGDILDKAFSMARAVVVLLTPDDEARLRQMFQSENDPPHETTFTGQARPNVLFEAGMAMGRHPERTILVECGRLRPFTDIAGLHVVRFDGESTTRQELAQRLQDAGCEVKMDGTDWHTTGAYQVRE